jgi:hypothetical protein
MRSRRPSAAGRRKGPESVTEQKTGYITADALQSKVVICGIVFYLPKNLEHDHSLACSARLPSAEGLLSGRGPKDV